MTQPWTVLTDILTLLQQQEATAHGEEGHHHTTHMDVNTSF